ncbi:MAG: SAM-dependent methyltransferase [Azovibrio sp.]|uniref:class I SAM-dependent methyltransferase n=1 Tax=Azovibrio sp. TaxID=1872673 RepID=UPI003C78C2EE
MSLPAPAPEALAHSQRLADLIRQEIRAAGGWISFARFMSMALYAPGLGYYTAGARKFGAAGDFVTAPELTPLFGRALARQAAQVMAASRPFILEAGAGSGRLAADLLLALEAMGSLPERYFILDISTDLRQRQRQWLAREVPRLLERVEWLDALPESFSGLVLGNELLDAMPVHCVTWEDGAVLEKGVALDADAQFRWQDKPAGGRLLEAATAIAGECLLPPGFSSEVALAAPAWVATWGERLEQGCLVLLDYGFPRREFYHPQRHGGTLMCHYRHQAHPEPFYLPGLQDITAHVDFTGIIAAAHPRGLELLGYTSQAQFLFNCGLLQDLETLGPGSLPYLKAAGAVQKLVQPQEMGELFKVIAIGKGLAEPLLGFARGDKSHRL